MASPLRDLVRELARQGAVLEHRAGARHVKIRYRGRLVGVLPTALDTDNPATLKRTRAQLRRAGLDVLNSDLASQSMTNHTPPTGRLAIALRPVRGGS